ncbi:MAG: alpha/beta hydrolase [Aureispira sp.]|nr:alpha/beta hydrolase [Aureispira sp.]
MTTIKMGVLGSIGISRGIAVDKLYPHYKTSSSQIFNIEGMPLHYRKTGKGPVLLLMHGVGSSLHTWDGWHQELSDDFTVLSIDLPSFGLTGPHPQNDYSVPMYMRVIDALLDHLKIDNAFVGGNSFGGFITWSYAVHNPKRVNKILLLDAAGFGTHRSDLKDFGFKLISHPILKRVTHLITPKKLIKQSVYNAYGDRTKIDDKLVDRYYHLLLRKGNREGFSDVLSKTILNEADYTPVLKSIQTPTYIIWGDRDRIISVKDAERFHAILPNSAIQIYKGVGHVPMEEIPKQSAQDARAFLLNDNI